MRYWLVAALALFVVGCGGSTNDNSGPGGNGGSGNGGLGGGGTGGSGGTGGKVVVPQPTDKADVLVMVDNSISMADKQVVLAEALPALVSALTTPPVDGSGKPLYAPVKDIHFGVITSSLGGHGADICGDGTFWHAQRSRTSRRAIAAGPRELPEPRIPLVGPRQQVWRPARRIALISNFQTHVQARGSRAADTRPLSRAGTGS